MSMYKQFLAFCTVLFALPSLLSAASFDCNKATTNTEVAICDDRMLSSLDTLMMKSWGRVDPKAFLSEQRLFLKERDACEDKTCLMNLMGTRVGQLLAISEGFQERIAETPFRFVPPKTVFVRCRRNYQGTDTLKYAELLFSFEENGATFQETNISMNGNHSESIWSWLIWSASASADHVNTSAYSQNVLRRNYPVTEQYISALKRGSMFSWIIYEDLDQGAAFVTFNFEPTIVKDCIDTILGQ